MQLNPLGFIAFLAIPLLLAIYFFQRKATRLPVSTLFLLKRTQLESKSGNRFERLLTTPPLWAQLLALLILCYILLQPKFSQKDEVVRIAVVIDASASMSAFKDESIKAIKGYLDQIAADQAVELTLLSSLANTSTIYRRR